jgi:hypothetical protein
VGGNLRPLEKEGTVITWRCSPASLDQKFLEDVASLLGNSPYSWYVVSGYRSIPEQIALYKKYQAGGPRAAPPGRSAHNFGLAVDVVLDLDSAKPGLQPSWNTKLPVWLWLKAKCAVHPRLKNGWSFNDWPHVEAVGWKGKRYPA